MNQQKVVVERIFKACKDTVWRALTEKEMMKQWYFDLETFDPVVGFKFEFMGGPEDGVQYKHLCEITEVIPESKLTYSWRYEGYEGITYVTFELFEENENTRLKLTHKGFETFPDIPDFAIHNFEAGWDDIINRSLKEFLEQEQPIKKMNNNPAFDFTVDKAAKTVVIKREFAAELSLVWDAFTKAELIDQWIAPKPYTAKTKYQDFKVGGKRFYAMISPEGEERWAIQEYTSITPKTNFKMYNAFADKDENPEPSGSEWDHIFSENGETTTVNITIYNESLVRMERILDGFTQGMKMALSNLENLLATLSKK